jgi:deoxyhypusine synthase
VKSFADVPAKGDALSAFLEKLPESFAVNHFRAVVNAVVLARQHKRPVVLGMGAHPIKLGLSPLIIDLMKNKIVTAIAMNGACAVHDFEVAMVGHTSEDVARDLCSGSFGMSKDPVNVAINRA